MLIDCDTCVARDIACDQCVIGVLLRSAGKPVDLDTVEQAAVGTLAEAGLVPPLRLVPALRIENGPPPLSPPPLNPPPRGRTPSTPGRRFAQGA